MALKERAHGDGILVNFNSPEAFDEIFWRVFLRGNYISSEGLLAHEINDELKEKFYRLYPPHLFSKWQKKRYLSKNNNNILRLHTLHQKLPQSIFLVPVRSPIQHAQDLLKQHLKFSTSGRFTKSYMKWLVHCEFGAHHKPFLFPQHSNTYPDSQQMNYWLERWLDAYSYLMKVEEKNTAGNIYFVCYEYLCEQKNYWHALANLIDISSQEKTAFRKHEDEIEFDYNKDLLEKANEIFKCIQKRSLDKLECIKSRFVGIKKN